MALTHNKDNSVLSILCDDKIVTRVVHNKEIVWEIESSDEFLNFEIVTNSDQPYYTVSIKNANNLPENGIVNIPSTHFDINQYDIPLSVASIKTDGFKKCKDMRSIIIPDSILEIGDNAFKKCNKLQTVQLTANSTLNKIGYAAFRGCTSLKSVTNLENLKYLRIIDNFAFASCNFENIVVSNSVEQINNSAFRWCNNLVNITLPTKINHMGNYVFASCDKLNEIYLPEPLKEVGVGVFAHCPNLQAIYCEADSKPKGWRGGWNVFGKPVFWGVEGAFDFDLLDDNTYSVRAIKSYLSREINIPNSYNGKSVRYISDNAFSGCDNITRVIIPDSVISIGRFAFSGCYQLENVVIPNTVISIGAKAFENCRKLADVVIPHSVTSIGEKAFKNCIKLTSITIPDSVTTIGNMAFKGCDDITIYCETSTSLPKWAIWWNGSNVVLRCNTEYLVEEESPIMNVDGISFLKYKNRTAKIMTYNKEEVGQDLVIPNFISDNDINYQVTAIGIYAFENCSSLKTITFEKSNQITYIGDYAFHKCSNLRSVDMLNGVTYIGNSAFSGCSSLKHVGLDTGADGSSQLVHIGDEAFSSCYNLVSFTVMKNTSTGGIAIPDGVTYIGNNAFHSCTSLSSVTISDNVTSIGDSAFWNCTELKRVIFGNNNKLAFISKNTFSYCPNLANIDIPNNVAGIDYSAFYGCSSLESISIPSNVYYIGAYAFKDCTNLTYVTFEDIENSKLQSIGYEAFVGCNIDQITLPDNINPNKISSDAFDKSVEINGGANGNALIDLATGTLLTAFNSTIISNILTNIGERAFSGITGIMNLIIPENITTITTEAFLNCFGLREVFIPSSVKYIQASAFKGCSGLTIKCSAPKKPDAWDDDWNPDNLPVVWGCLDSTASDELFTYELLSDNTYSIKAKNKNLLSGRLVIPSSYQGTPVTKIAANGFSGCNVTWVDVLSGIKTIEYGAFKNCSMLLDINFPETLEYIGADAFYGCENLALIQLPNNIKTIETWAFRDCDKAKTIYIPESVEMINNGAFIGVNVDERTIWCENTEAEISAKGWSTTWNAKDITGITKFPVIYNAAAVTDASKFEFRTTMDGNYYVKPASLSIAEDMVVVHVPSSYNGKPVTEIGSFGDCKNLVKMILPDLITKLRVEAFGGDRYEGTSGCTNLNEINLPNSLKWIGDGAFLGSSITNLVIPENVEQSTLNNVFMNCQQLRHITLPESWTEIGQEMFKGCTNLTDIVLPNKCTYIGSKAFYDCSNLQNVYLYNKHWQVGNTVLDLTDKTAAEVAQLLTSPEYSNIDWTIAKTNTPVLYSELDEHFVEFTVENPNNTPQMLTVSLTLKDGSADSIEEIYYYSETYTMGANQSITEIFDMPLTEDYSGLMAFSYAELVAHFENSNETKLILANNNEVCEQNGHSYVDTVIAPTCTTRGYTRHECKVCGHTYDDSYVEIIEHTCESNTIAPTCTTSGYTEYTCSTCGHYYIDNYVAALGHTEVIDPAVWATCTTSGKTEGSHCSRCGKIIVPQALIPALGHSWKDATCTTPKTCETCGETEGEALGHTWIDATCTEPKTCSVCGETTGEPLGHSYGAWTTTVAPTCTKFGTMERTCNRCGEIEVEPIPALGHDYKAVVTEPTCTAQGYTTYTCTRCGDSYVDNYTDALGHDYKVTKYVVQGCVEDGYRIYTCSRCGDTYTEVIPADGVHSYSATVVPPTCTAQGYTEYVCDDCGETYRDNYTNALGHTWGDWEEVHPAECERDGMRERKCTVCGEIETETIPALGHDWDTEVEVVKPTCTDGGYTIHTCNACGHTYRDNYTEPLGHISSDWIIDVEPTTETEGSKHKECTRCGVILETAVIEKLPSDDETTYLVNNVGNYLSDNSGNLLVIQSSNPATCLITEDGNNLTDEQGNLLII